MRIASQIVIGACAVIAATALLGSGAPKPDPTAMMSWTDAVAQSVRDGRGNIVSTLRDMHGNSLGVLVVNGADGSVEWSPVGGAARSLSSQSSFAGGAGLQEANNLAYATWNPGSKVANDCQSECSPDEWCCTCEASGGGSCGTCCELFPSDRNIKANFEPVRGEDVLDRLAAIPITRWSYKTDGPSVRHVGPMAQDFRAAFGLGSTDKAIAVVDGNGIALAAIQALNTKVEALVSESAALRDENRELRARLQELVTRLPAAR
jgi:hypothetical protein